MRVDRLVAPSRTWTQMVFEILYLVFGVSYLVFGMSYLVFEMMYFGWSFFCRWWIDPPRLVGHRPQGEEEHVGLHLRWNLFLGKAVLPETNLEKRVPINFLVGKGLPK